MRLRFTPRAADELDDILEYLAARSPQGQRRVKARLQFVINLLLDQPYSGRRTSLRGGRVRRLVATPFPYLVFYVVADDEIVIVGVRHGARDPRGIPQGDAV